MKTVKISEAQLAKLVENWKEKTTNILKEEEMSTDCRSNVGITIGLIDSLISISRILKNRIDTDNAEINGALADLRDDEDLKKILQKKES